MKTGKNKCVTVRISRLIVLFRIPDLVYQICRIPDPIMVLTITPDTTLGTLMILNMSKSVSQKSILADETKACLRNCSALFRCQIPTLFDLTVPTKSMAKVQPLAPETCCKTGTSLASRDKYIMVIGSNR